jgi:hypothetical protein
MADSTYLWPCTRYLQTHFLSQAPQLSRLIRSVTTFHTRNPGSKSSSHLPKLTPVGSDRAGTGIHCPVCLPVFPMCSEPLSPGLPEPSSGQSPLQPTWLILESIPLWKGPGIHGSPVRDQGRSIASITSFVTESVQYHSFIHSQTSPSSPGPSSAVTLTPASTPRLGTTPTPDLCTC